MMQVVAAVATAFCFLANHITAVTLLAVVVAVGIAPPQSISGTI